MCAYQNKIGPIHLNLSTATDYPNEHDVCTNGLVRTTVKDVPIIECTPISEVCHSYLESTAYVLLFMYISYDFILYIQFFLQNLN